MLSAASWGANLLIVVGLWFSGSKRWWAFLFTAVGEIVWASVAVYLGMYDLAFVCAIFTVLAIRNLLLWRRDRPQTGKEPACQEQLQPPTPAPQT